MNPPQVYTCSPSWTPLYLPPCTIPLGHPSAPAPSIQYPASNLDRRFVSHMIWYMFQCHSPKSSHPRPLPQSPKDCSIHQCLFCCLAYRVFVTIFLNSIYMRILYWCFSFWLTSLCIIGSSFIHLIRTDFKRIFSKKQSWCFSKVQTEHWPRTPILWLLCVSHGAWEQRLSYIKCV